MRTTSGLCPALLKFWRGRRGLSQLDLALAAEVSARHVSFLETGRAQPSREMVLRLGAALAVPLRDQDAMLRAAGFQPVFEERGLEAGLPPAIAQAIERMMAQQEPYPLVVMNRGYEVLRANAATFRLLPRRWRRRIRLPAARERGAWTRGPRRGGAINFVGNRFDGNFARGTRGRWVSAGQFQNRHHGRFSGVGARGRRVASMAVRSASSSSAGVERGASMKTKRTVPSGQRQMWWAVWRGLPSS